jgi:hypothetical protein
MKNRQILTYLAFLLLLVVCDQLTGRWVASQAKKQIRDNRIGLLLEGKIPASIYILGSSRALNNYDPAVIAATTGKTCYNLGVSGSSVVFHESLLDIIMENNRKPEYIFYNIDDYATLFSMDEIVYREELLYPYVDNPGINRMVCERKDKKEFATIASNAYRQNVNFFNALKYIFYGREVVDYKTTKFDSLGANLLVNRPEDEAPVFGIRKKYRLSRMIPDAEHMEAFRQIQRKCLDNKIKLVLILPPLYYAPSEYFRLLVKKEIMPGVALMDFTYHMQDANLFFNRDHLNKTGAGVFSAKVAEQFNATNM